MPPPSTSLPRLLSQRLIHDSSALGEGINLAAVVRLHRLALAEANGEFVGPLTIRASQVDEFRPLADPEGALAVALVADGGLMALQTARHAVQDDTWITLDYVEIALPSGFSPAESARALLDELALTVPTYVEVPRTGFDTALDVLAEDGVERATYRCGGIGPNPVPTDGELAAFVHGAIARNVPFSVTAGLEHAVRGDNGDGAHHGSLNVIAAVAAARDGASTSDLAALLASRDADALLATIGTVAARTLSTSFHGFGSADVGATIDELHALGAFAHH